MAGLEFSPKMNSEELCAYLKEVGMEEDDLRKISGKTLSQSLNQFEGSS